MSPVIATSNLTKDFISHMLRKRTRIIDGLTLTVEKNQTYGLLGLNGAGKTTILRLFLGFLKPTSGEIKVLDTKPGDKRALRHLGFLPENPYFYNYLTAAEFLDFVGQIFGMTKKERTDRAKELLEVVVMKDAADKPVRKFSKGMMQRLGIAQSLMNDPDLVFWDEPMSGLDPVGRRDIRQILFGLKERGKTIFFNSHLLPDVNEVCDRVGVLHKGKLVAEDTIKSISGGGSYQKLEDYFLEAVGAEDAKINSKKFSGDSEDKG